MSDQTTDIDVMAVNLLQRERIAELEAELKWLQNQHVRVCSKESRLREAATRAKDLLWRIATNPIEWSKAEVSMVYRELEAALLQEQTP